jgi:septal ring factor EnvC (AmiA/AmiB activator)
LTAFDQSRYDPRRPGGAIPEVSGNAGIVAVESESAYDFKRLEHAVTALLGSTERLRKENRQLREQLASRVQRIQSLESELRNANQRRQDIAKRVDELIAQIDQLDAQLGQAEES